jgi:hypothetical protein
MKNVLTTLILIGLISCEKNKGHIDLQTTDIKAFYQDLTRKQEIKFEDGDSWGTISIYSNADSSVVRVIIDFDNGDYGNGRNEYLAVENRLIYQRDSVSDWLIVKSPMDSNNYKLRETILQFDSDSMGTKTSKAVYSLTADFNNEKKKEFNEKPVDSVKLNKDDYIKALDELRRVLGQH